MTDYKQEIEDCYCVCHFASSSKPSCEHCYGYNEVGITNNSNITIPATALTHLINKADSMNEIANMVAKHKEVDFVFNGKTYHIKELEQ